MKKFLLVLLILLAPTLVLAEGTVVQAGNSYDLVAEKMKIATFTITSDAGSVPNTAFLDFVRGIQGWYIFSVEMYSATDDAWTVTITTALGSEIYAYTTTAATTGHLEKVNYVFPIYSVPNIDVTNLADTESCTVIVAFAKP